MKEGQGQIRRACHVMSRARDIVLRANGKLYKFPYKVPWKLQSALKMWITLLIFFGICWTFILSTEIIFAGNMFLASEGKYEVLVLLKLLILISLTLNLKKQVFKRSS